MTVSQKVQIVTFDYGPSLSDVTLRNLLTDALITGGTADTCNELAADAGVYIADFVNANAAALIPAGKYRLRAVVNGAPLNRYVTLVGTDGEVVQSSNVPLDEVLSAIDTYISSVTAAVSGSAGTIVGFPSSLTIGDSYTEDGDNAIHVFIRDENDDPITSVGTHEFTDSDFAPELVITNSGNAGRVRATVTYVDPGAAESYLKVEIPLAESRRAAPGSATMQCVLKWDGCAKTIATQSVTWVARI